MHPRLRAGLQPVRCGRPGFGGRAPALSPNAGRPGPHRVRGTRPCPADLRRFTEGPRRQKKKNQAEAKALGPRLRGDDDGVSVRSVLLLRQGLPRSALPGSSRSRRAGAGKARRVARRMRASLPSVQGRAVGKPRSLLAKGAGRDARAPRPRGCPFFGYFLWASKESDSAARTADEKTHGRESVLAKRLKNKRQNQNGSRLSPG
jgi:hypothetical protein